MTTPILGNTSGNYNHTIVINNGDPHFNNMTSGFENGSSTSQEEEISGFPLQWGMLGLTLIVVCTAAGNVLVCLAVCWEKRLQNMTNYFLMSLAIADLLVSLLVMPVGMIVEIFGHFPMNPEICVLWVASDVLMCSASIWHMCTMSMDRYFTLKYPMRYGRNKTRRMVAGKILFVWIVSVAISSPVCIHGFIDTTSVFSNGDCMPTVKNFVIYGSIFAFYIPLMIMIVTYVLTIRILWKNQQRMKHIDRSELKPRLAQLTAQYTGFAIPKLLTSFKKPSSRSPSTHSSLSRTKGEKQLLSVGATTIYNNKPHGNINVVVSDGDLSEEGEGGRLKSGVGVTYLAPPSPEMYTSRSPSPTPINIYSDTEESENEPNYFSLTHTNNSFRSLCTPISMSTSEKSLHKRLQKKQLYQHQQHQQQEMKLLNHEKYQQRQYNSDDNTSTCLLKKSTPYSSSEVIHYTVSELITTSPPLSPLFDNDIEKPLQQPLQPINSAGSQTIQPINSAGSQTLQTSPTASKLSRQSSTNDSLTGNHAPKKKRYSKRCKKRCNSLSQNSKQTDHLKVPSHVNLGQGFSAQQSTGQKTLITSVSDTHVSQFGRRVKSDDEHDVVPFHLNHGNLGKDYKSMEWDKRYFQIQEEMDLCLQGDFSRCDPRATRPVASEGDQPTTETNGENVDGPDKKTLLRPEVSLPIHLPEDFRGNNNIPFSNRYSHSAPNSPLNRRNPDFPKLTSSSDDEREDDVDDENKSDKNDEAGNDTTGSSNSSDVITIRLHPPTPKVKNCNDPVNQSWNPRRTFSDTDRETSLLDLNTCPNVNNNLFKTKHLNGFPHNNSDVNNTFKNGLSLHSLSPAGTSLPELIVSSEGEMTLEETDDTLDDSPNNTKVKLRRPCRNSSPKSKYTKNNSPLKHKHPEDKFAKRKQPSFRRTFRIHKGKYSVKHVMSKKTATNEKKASKVLGIIFLVFVVLWTPFFALNILNAICDSCTTGVSKEIMSLFLWMGYIASLANPIIYTMFNTAFRKTFIRILTCKIQRTCRTKSSDTHLMSYTTILASERRNTMTVVLRDESR